MMEEAEDEELTIEQRISKLSVEEKCGAEIEDDIPLFLFNVTLTERKSRIAVKFSTKTGGVLVQSFDPSTDIETIKLIVAAVIQVKPERLDVITTDLTLMEYDPLNEFKNDPHEALPCTITSEKIKERIVKLCDYEDLVIPDRICSAVKDSVTDMTKCVPVQIFNRSIDKPWDGGWRNKLTGVEYHNGFSQTGPRPPNVIHILRNSRDTQTRWRRNRKLDMSYSRATQMCKNDTFIPCITDRILTPGEYETAEELERRLNIEAHVRTIQRYYRAWKMRKCLKDLHFEYQRRLLNALLMDEQEKEEDRRRRRRDLICQAFPRTMFDFEMLYAVVGRWKQKEISRIEKMHCGPAKIAELALLSDKEVEVFKMIEKLELVVRHDTQRQNYLNYLKKLGTPTKSFCSYKCLPIEFDSIENQKARELDKMYQKVLDRNRSEIKRMDALLELKLSLREDDCQIAMDLTELIDRSLDLLSRGFKNETLEPLQRRIESCMLYHFKQKECFDYLTVIQEEHLKQHMRKNLFVCARCKRMKPIECFTLDTRSQQVNECNNCKWLDKNTEPTVDLSPYRFILHQVRKFERLHYAFSSICFILRDEDVYHLVTQIWHSRSAISEVKDVYNLRMIRWQRDLDWSPWNCILLTPQEGKAHLKVDDLEKVYEKEFRNHVFNKHALARKHFRGFAEIERQISTECRI